MLIENFFVHQTLYGMDAIEFVANYKKYVSEIAAVVRDNLSPIVEAFENKDPHKLVTPETRFPNETTARGFVWGLFIDAVNDQSHKTITIDIDDINNLEDMEMFFALIYREGILYHPDFSFDGYMNTDINGKQTVRTFTDEESERLDRLNEKCFEVAGIENIDVYRTSMRIQKLIWGDPKKRRLVND